MRTFRIVAFWAILAALMGSLIIYGKCQACSGEDLVLIAGTPELPSAPSMYCAERECEICGLVIYSPESDDEGSSSLSALSFSSFNGITCMPYAYTDAYTSRAVVLCSECHDRYWSGLRKILGEQVQAWVGARQAERAKARERNARGNHGKRLDQLEQEVEKLKKVAGK